MKTQTLVNQMMAEDRQRSVRRKKFAFLCLTTLLCVSTSDSREAGEVGQDSCVDKVLRSRDLTRSTMDAAFLFEIVKRLESKDPNGALRVARINLEANMDEMKQLLPVVNNQVEKQKAEEVLRMIVRYRETGDR